MGAFVKEKATVRLPVASIIFQGLTAVIHLTLELEKDAATMLGHAQLEEISESSQGCGRYRFF